MNSLSTFSPTFSQSFSPSSLGRTFVLGAAVFLEGLLAGAMLVVTLALVPFWRSMAPLEFRAWFQRNGHFVGDLMLPLLLVAGIAAACALLSLWRSAGGRQRARLAFAAFALALIIVTYPFVHGPLNDALLDGAPLTEAQISALLRQWAAWNWPRAVLGLAAFLASLAGLAGLGRARGVCAAGGVVAA